MQKPFFIVLLLISFLGTNAQKDRDNQLLTDTTSFQKKVIGRVNFMGLLDVFDRNISIGTEYGFAPNWSTGLDVGYIFLSEYIRQGKGARGVLLRPFIRYYFKEKRTGFLEAQLHYKAAAYKVSDWLGRDVINGVPSYEELVIFDFDKKVIGLNLVIGDKFRLSKNNDNIKFEPYMGLGARLKKQQAEKGTYIPDTNLFTDVYETNFSYMAILMGMRLTFRM